MTPTPVKSFLLFLFIRGRGCLKNMRTRKNDTHYTQGHTHTHAIRNDIIIYKGGALYNLFSHNFDFQISLIYKNLDTSLPK